MSISKKRKNSEKSTRRTSVESGWSGWRTNPPTHPLNGLIIWVKIRINLSKFSENIWLFKKKRQTTSTLIYRVLGVVFFLEVYQSITLIPISSYNLSYRGKTHSSSIYLNILDVKSTTMVLVQSNEGISMLRKHNTITIK